MNPNSLFPFSLSEIWWRGIILALSLTVLLFSVWCLAQGITIIFMHLYYFPIVLLAYRYRWKGCGLATLLALSYLGLVLTFDAGQPDVILGAFYRFLVFVGIAAVIAYLADRLAISQSTMQQSAELRDRYLSLAPAIVLALDRNGAITFLSKHGGEILECRPDDAVGKFWVEQFLPEKDRVRVKGVFSKLIAGQVEQNRIVENLVMTCGGAEKIIRWHNTVLHDNKGTISGILAFGEDITEEKWRQETLNKMQQFQESVITNANVWISVLEPDGTLLVWNDAAEAISGYKKTGVLGKRTVWKQLYPDNEYRKKVTGNIQRIIRRDTFLENFETEIRCADGTKKIIVWNTRGQRDIKGIITSYIAIGRDITAQKSAEFRAGESSRFLAAMIDTLPIPVFFKDMNGSYLGCNTPFEEYIGIKRDQLIGKTAYDISPKDLADRYTEADRQIFENPLPQRYETQVQYADGSRHDVIFYKAPFFNNDGSVGGLIGAYLDISERKLAEEALQESETFNRGLVENLPDYIAVYGLDGKILYLNPSSARALGYDADTLVGTHVLTYIAEEYHDTVKAKMAIRQKEGDASPYEIDMITRDGLRRSVIVKATPIQYRNNPAILLLLIDITERKQAEEAIQRSGREWQTTFDAINDVVYLLDDKSRIVRHNRAFETFTGKSAEEIDGRYCFEIMHGTGYPIKGCPNVQTQFSRQRESIELNIDNRWFVAAVDPIIDKNGKITGAVHLITDITERKAAEVVMQENEEKYRVLFTQMTEGSALHDMVYDGSQNPVDYRIIDVNPAFERILGLKREDVIGKTGREAYGVDVPPFLDIYARVASTGQPDTSEVYFAPMKKHFAISIYSPRAGRFATIFADITERKAAEETLRESKTLTDAVVENVPLMIFLKEARDLRFVIFNRAGEELLGYDRQALLGKNNLDLFPPEQAAHFMEKDREVLDGEAGMLDIPEEPIMTAKKGLRLLHTRKVCIRGSDGTTKFLLGISEDITERKAAEETLRSREEQFRVIFHNQQTGLVMVDAVTHTIADANAAALNMIGASRDEVIGKICHTFICPAEKGKCPVADLGQTVDNSERVLIRANGEKIPILKSVNPVKIGGRSFLIESFIDLSERKRMEEQISESRQLFADIISFLPDPTFVIDKEGKVLAWNRALEQLSGVSAGDIIGKGEYEYSRWLYGKRRPILIDLVLLRDQDAGRLNYTDIHWEEHTVTAQTDIIQPGSGNKTSLLLVASPLIDANGNVTGAIESMRDISRLKEAEAELAHINANLEKIVKDRTEALSESERKYRILFDKTRDALLIIENNKFVDCNAATLQMLGYKTKDELFETHPSKISPPTQPDGRSSFEKAEEMMAIALRDGSHRFEWVHRRSNGEDFWVEVSLTAIPIQDHQIIHTAWRDITDRKKAEAEIRTQLEEKVILLREIHHRVKNNLQIIISLVNLQMRQTDDPVVKQIMSETQNRVRAMSLVHEKLYRSESLSRIDFADYTRYLATQLISFYGSDKQRVRLDFEMEKILVDINTAVPLGLLMSEIISNALKHAFPNGREGTISIIGGYKGDLITLVVRDNGIGIPADFDWKNTTSLGMRLVTSLVDQIDGTIVLDRSQGTAFTITIKRDPAPS